MGQTLSVIPILLTFMYMVALESISKQPTQLIVELNSSLRHIIVTHLMSTQKCRTFYLITETSLMRLYARKEHLAAMSTLN